MFKKLDEIAKAFFEDSSVMEARVKIGSNILKANGLEGIKEINTHYGKLIIEEVNEDNIMEMVK